MPDGASVTVSMPPAVGSVLFAIVQEGLHCTSKCEALGSVMIRNRIVEADVHADPSTIDVLNAQQDLTNARSRLIPAQRDRVTASYTLLSAVGRLDVHTLNLNTPDYLPDVHYHQVRDAWHGVRTPSGQ